MIDRVYTIEHKKWDKKFSLTLEPISPKMVTVTLIERLFWSWPKKCDYNQEKCPTNEGINEEPHIQDKYETPI